MITRNLAILLVLFGLISTSVEAGDWFDARWYGVTGPCDGKCSVMVFGGQFVETPMTDIFLEGNVLPSRWSFGDGAFVGFAASRKIASFWNETLMIEPEIGFGKRFGNMDEYEAWAAIFLRYDGFPWNDYIYTTVAVSTGLNYASGISEIEKERAGNGKGSRILHYLAPEITFALPKDKSKELVVRFHHRSGGYGLVSDSDGGAQYLTVGLRFHF